jgi:zinc protease
MMRRRPLQPLLILCLAFLLAGGSSAIARPAEQAGSASLIAGVARHVLPNGVTLLVRPSRHAPVAAVVTYVKVGYFDEPDRVAGMAHLFEHMFFKGSRRYPDPAAIATAVRRLGGQSNAGTSYDATTYYITVPREGVTAAMEIQADAIASPLFDAEGLKREAEVVIEESNRKYDNPPALAMEKMFAAAFTQHRMRRWRIGSDEVLRNIRRDDLLQFYETLYRPENLIVSVVGDVDVPAVVATAQRTYGALPRGAVRREPGPGEPPQTALRVATLSGDIQHALLTVGFHVPGVNHTDTAALEVLATLLGQGRGSRLYPAAVRAGLAQSADASHYATREVGVFTVQARVDPVKLEAMEDRLFEEIERLKRRPPSEEELMRARNQVETDFALGLEEVLGQARLLAREEANGSYRNLERYLERIRALRPADLQAVARRYLTLENATIHRYLPKASALPEPNAVALSRRLSERMAQVKPETTKDQGPRTNDRRPTTNRAPSREATDRPEHRTPSTGSAATLQRFTLNNGARLLVLERHTAPTVNLTLAFVGGKSSERPEEAGITQLMLSCMPKGTRDRDAAAIDRAIEGLGTSLQTTVGDDTFTLSMSLLAQNLSAGIGILSEVLRQPTFPDAEVSRARELQLGALRQARDDANQAPIVLLRRAIYGDHSYGWPAEGRETTVPALDAARVRDWYRRVVEPGVLWIVVVGDVQTAEVRQTLTGALGDWRTRSAAAPVSIPAARTGAPSSPVAPERVETRARRQTAFALGFPTAPFGHPDHPVLDTIQFLTSGLAGRFGVELRSKQSLAYVTGAAQQSRAQAGLFFGYLAGQYDKEPRAREAMRAELARLTREPVGEEELARTKSAMAGAMKLRLQTNAMTAADLARNAILAGDPNYTTRYLEQVADVTAADVQRVATAYFGDRFAVGVLRGGPPSERAAPPGPGSEGQ